MSLIGFLIALVCIAALCWVVRDYISLPDRVKMIFYVIALIVLIYLLLSIAGLNLQGIHLGKG